MSIAPPIEPPQSPARQKLDELRVAAAATRAVAAKRESTLSTARLVAGLAALLPWLFAVSWPLTSLVVSLLGVAAFVVAMRRHFAARADLDASDRLLLVIDESLRRCGGELVCIREGGRPAVSAEDRLLPPLLDPGPAWSLTEQERDDLDLYARPVGLFGLLNRASWQCGARRLRDMLEQPCLSPLRIAARQAMVHWLSEHPAERLRLMSGLAALRGEERRLAALIEAIASASTRALPLPPGVLSGWTLVSGGLTLVLLALVLDHARICVPLLLGLAIVNRALRHWLAPQAHAAIRPWREVDWALRATIIAARESDENLPHETELDLLRREIAALRARRALERLRRYTMWTEGGGGVQWLANTYFLADLHTARAISHTAESNRETLLRGLSALADLDALCGAGAFAFEQPLVCEVVPETETRLMIRDGRHPLVAPHRVVGNDVSLDGERRVWIITGSNMGGKSTLLRMVGLNVLLAQAFGIATAREMRLSPLRLITDLRTRDNLADGESYFLAEVRHVRRLVLPPEGDAPLLGLIDEPFRGTNSQEQTAASVAVVRRLMSLPHLFLIATHDRALTTLADGVVAANMHFEDRVGESGLSFDYRLREGPATTRNALRILEHEGYPPDLLRQAHEWLGE